MKNLIKKILIVILLLIPIIVRIALFDLTRIHGDDMLTAYFSAHYNIFKTNPLAPVPQNKADWVCQFPSTFFVLQKMFFSIFGASLLTIKLSVMPYVLLVSGMLFLIVRKIFNGKTAIISVILYAFYAPSLYLETLGLHFISSTAIFMVFFYFLLLHHEKPTIKSILVVGIFCGLSYLFYSSSYIAILIYFMFFIGELILKKEKSPVVKHYFFGFLVFILILLPFIFQMAKTRNFYFAGRANQVNLLSGEWSVPKDQIKKPINYLLVVKDNFLLSIKSLYQDGIGGHGGYNFGHLAFFDKFTLLIFLAGFTLSWYYVFRKYNYGLFWVLIITMISFVAGIVLTIPPPAFHRFSLAFPFLVMISSVPLYMIIMSKIHAVIKYALLAIIIVIFCITNLNHFNKQTSSENDNESLRLGGFIKNNYPQRNLYVASFPGYNFEKIYYFIDNTRLVETDYHTNFLQRFNTKEKYIYVIIFPDVFNEKFQRKDPHGRIENFNNNFSLLYNE